MTPRAIPCHQTDTWALASLASCCLRPPAANVTCNTPPDGEPNNLWMAPGSVPFVGHVNVAPGSSVPQRCCCRSYHQAEPPLPTHPRPLHSTSALQGITTTLHRIFHMRRSLVHRRPHTPASRSYGLVATNSRRCTRQCCIKSCQGWHPARVSAWPIIHRLRRARVSATFMRRTSDRKPTPPAPLARALRGRGAQAQRCGKGAAAWWGGGAAHAFSSEAQCLCVRRGHRKHRRHASNVLWQLGERHSVRCARPYCTSGRGCWNRAARPEGGALTAHS